MSPNLDWSPSRDSNPYDHDDPEILSLLRIPFRQKGNLMMVLPPRFELGLSELEALCAIHYTTRGKKLEPLPSLGSVKGHVSFTLGLGTRPPS